MLSLVLSLPSFFYLLFLLLLSDAPSFFLIFYLFSPFKEENKGNDRQISKEFTSIIHCPRSLSLPTLYSPSCFSPSFLRGRRKEGKDKPIPRTPHSLPPPVLRSSPGPHITSLSHAPPSFIPVCLTLAGRRRKRRANTKAGRLVEVVARGVDGQSVKHIHTKMRGNQFNYQRQKVGASGDV